MSSASEKSGFVEKTAALAGSNMLPAPTMAFVGSEGPHEIPYVFFPVLFQMNRRGLVALVRPFDEMEEGQEIHVSWNSAKGTTTVTLYVQDRTKHQIVGFTEEQALVHQGELVTVTYHALVGGEPRPSSASWFTIAKADLDIDNLPELQHLDVDDGVLQLKNIEAQGYARFRLPPITGLHRGVLLSLTLESESQRETVGQLIKTTPDAEVVFFVPYRVVAEFIGKEVFCRYAIWLLENVAYTKSNREDTIKVEL